MSESTYAQGPFYNEIQAFQKQDSATTSPQHAILFIGSSSFTNWRKVHEAFSGYTTINRLFGGSALPHVIRNVETIVYPYHPPQVVIYCGGNDLASFDTVTAQTMAGRFGILFGLIRDSFPKVPVTFVSLKPSPGRERLFLR